MKFKIGDKVKHIYGHVGVITEIDNSDLPYKVKYLEGDHWHLEKNLTKIESCEELERLAHDLKIVTEAKELVHYYGSELNTLKIDLEDRIKNVLYKNYKDSSNE